MQLQTFSSFSPYSFKGTNEREQARDTKRILLVHSTTSFFANRKKIQLAQVKSPNDENTTVLSGLFGLLLGQLFQQHLLHDLLFFDEEGADNANHRA
ncbi:hypothetical protein Ae201684_001491 [Aphanomyces euteiches]|uniref:Uncharacterized protein n=1 Tax=Aphanomyces euteiches TaxID=100861 RepID=A0A6G0XT82_9STRA|nr:hypothetical protein Ae201684_001491 [Aphanomyces euteiches]